MSYLVLEKVLTIVVLSLLISAFSHFNETIQSERGADQIASATDAATRSAANPVVPNKMQKLVKMSFRSNTRRPASL